MLNEIKKFYKVHIKLIQLLIAVFAFAALYIVSASILIADTDETNVEHWSDNCGYTEECFFLCNAFFPDGSTIYTSGYRQPHLQPTAVDLNNLIEAHPAVITNAAIMCSLTSNVKTQNIDELGRKYDQHEKSIVITNYDLFEKLAEKLKEHGI